MQHLSRRQDELGYHYGFIPNDPRQVNVRAETPHRWVAYVGGTKVGGFFATAQAAERGAIFWMEANPVDAGN